MSHYLTHLNHFRFAKEGDTLVVTSEIYDSFERVFEIPDDLDETDEEELFNEYYTELISEYKSEKS